VIDGLLGFVAALMVFWLIVFASVFWFWLKAFPVLMEALINAGGQTVKRSGSNPATRSRF
jgi:hypothetical protein